MARRLVHDLGVARLRVWLDVVDMPDSLRHFRLGEDIAHLHQELGWGIYRAETVLVLLSPSAVRSRWVEFELGIAEFNGARMVPLLLRPCEIPLGDRRGRSSAADHLRVPVPGGVSFRWPLAEAGHGWGYVARTIMMSRLVNPRGRVESLHRDPGFQRGYFDFTDPAEYADSILALALLLARP